VGSGGGTSLAGTGTGSLFSLRGLRRGVGVMSCVEGSLGVGFVGFVTLGLSRRMPPAEPARLASGVELAAFLERAGFGAGGVVVFGPGEEGLEDMVDGVHEDAELES
jgi:hypothetical protein